MYAELRPAYLNEDYYVDVTIAANVAGWTLSSSIFPPGSTSPIAGAITATILSTSETSSVVQLSVVGQTLQAGENTINLYRTDTGSRLCVWTGLLEVTGFPSAQGG
jgi:hypothetical protein